MLPPGLCEGPGDSAGVPGAEQQARCVWIVRSLRFIHIFDGPAPENRPQIGQFVYGHVDPEKRYTAFHEKPVYRFENMYRPYTKQLVREVISIRETALLCMTDRELAIDTQIGKPG